MRVQPEAGNPGSGATIKPGGAPGGGTGLASPDGAGLVDERAEAKARPRAVSASTAPLAAKFFGFDEARHLLWRAGFGGTPEQINLLASWGLEKSVEYLVNFDQVKAEAVAPGTFRDDIMREPTAEERMAYRDAQRARDENKLAELRVRRQQAEQDDREQARQVQRWWLKRMVETARPLEEKMTLFWHGHFATSYRTIEDSYHMFMQNQLFRAHAVGSYAELLRSIIRDPAMLKYLNNNESRKGKPNENLARELMELFSLGVGNYGEDDIKQGARALTGYTFKDDGFFFDQKNHDTGAKTILGRSGNLDGDGFVSAILEQRACAEYMATKLYRFFAHDYPTGHAPFDAAAREVIKDLASVLRRNDYRVAPVLERLFKSQHFYDPIVRSEQIKSPVQLVVGAIRSLNTPVRDLGAVISGMRFMGQDILFPPSVKGWDGGRAWINTATLFIRQNMLVFLITGRRPQGVDALASEERWDAAAIVSQIRAALGVGGGGGGGSAGVDTSGTLDAVLRFALGRTDPAGREVLEAYLKKHNDELTPGTLTDLMLLITAMPEYQLC